MGSANSEGIASHITGTVADWVVVVHFTQGINATYTWTWIFTLIIDTCFVIITISIGDTFRTAQHIWISNIIGNAWTLWLVVFDITLSVGPTRRWYTWGSWRLNSHHWFRWNGWCHLLTMNIGITHKSSRTEAHRTVGINFTMGIDATSIWTRINTPSADACQIATTVSVYTAFWFAPFCCVCLTEEVW